MYKNIGIQDSKYVQKTVLKEIYEHQYRHDERGYLHQYTTWLVDISASAFEENYKPLKKKKNYQWHVYDKE